MSEKKPELVYSKFIRMKIKQPIEKVKLECPFKIIR